MQQRAFTEGGVGTYQIRSQNEKRKNWNSRQVLKDYRLLDHLTPAIKRAPVSISLNRIAHSCPSKETLTNAQVLRVETIRIRKPMQCNVQVVLIPRVSLCLPSGR